jgi:ribosomal protein S18 acetylase RimI-like enzyme
MMVAVPLHPLDNVVWHSLTGPRAALGTRLGKAARLLPDVGPFTAIEDSSADAWSDLAELLGPHGVACLFAPGVTPADGWEELDRIPCGQLVAEHLATDGESQGLVELTHADVPEMLELVAATKPGPFAARTIDFGGYVGLRDADGRLLAMAGERLSGGGFTEVSAVCTVPDQQGRGLGTRMVKAVVERVRARGEEAFLHVADSNVNAYRLYLALGFTERCKPNALILRVPS